MAAIDFIYFDLGNVILKFDHATAFRNVARVSGITPEQVEHALVERGLQNQYETGLFDCTQFHQKFCDLTSSHPNIESFMSAMSDIFWVNQPMIPVLTQLKARAFPMGILSNTCHAHWKYVLERHSVLRDFFDPIVVSYQEKSMKPDATIYKNAITKAGVDAGRIFFTDDRQENVDGAIAVGINAELFTSVRSLVRWLNERGVHFNG